ncbi:NADAR family protein [Mycobacterium camsae]|uniref:NADAR family protein n=1 Tax=Mycobacterium gordonae TaxID=1778 RepID=UPI0019812D73|nr:NADAR family protein [Mycobacterium gordonae]
MSGLWVPVIDRFRGEHFFLSNFYPAITPHRGRIFATSEHAYMAAKTDDTDARAAILASVDPLEAQRIGRAAPLVDGWDRSRFPVMEEIVTAKFTHNLDLAAQLHATTGSLLLEGNDWHDQTWGSCRCDEHHDIPGANALGVILMAMRLRLFAKRPSLEP